MNKTITSVKRYINDLEVTREELLSRRVSNPVLDHLYQTALRRIAEKQTRIVDKQSS